LVSAGLGSILVGVGVLIVVAIVEPDLHSGVPVCPDTVIVAIDTKIKTAAGCFYSIAVAIDRQSAIGSRDDEVIVVAVDIDGYFAIADDESIVIAVYVEVDLFVLDIDSTVATRIVHLLLLLSKSAEKASIEIEGSVEAVG
jgi:hypothetical protein